MKSFRDKYRKNLKLKTIDFSSAKTISELKRGRPLMLGQLDEKIKTFFLDLRKNEGPLILWLRFLLLKLLLKNVTTST